MPPENRSRFWEIAKASPGSPRRRRARGGKPDRAAHVERLLALEPRVLLATFTVVNTDDGGPGSLRDAIAAANALAGADSIAFNIPGPGVKTIAPNSALPAITDPLTIDGATQPGFGATRPIQIAGFAAGPGANGLVVAASGTTIRGLTINGFARDGIAVVGPISDVVIAGNYLGTDPEGRSPGIDAGNGGAGVSVAFATSVTVGGTTAADRNVIAGNAAGVVVAGLSGAASAAVVRGNFVGVDASGVKAAGNALGIAVVGPAAATIGGSVAGAGNVISGNASDGLFLGVGSLAVVQGNRIGTDVGGTSALGNGSYGVRVLSPGNTIGGASAAARNVISGNAGAGVVVSRGEGNRILGNYLGLDATGTAAVPNAAGGVALEAASGTTIGGTAFAARNVISGNGAGGVLASAGVTGSAILGNFIGTNADGTAGVGNAGPGVEFANSDPGLGVANNTIGGSPGGARNLISGNAGDGIRLVDPVAAANASSVKNTVVRSNLIGTDVFGTGAIGNAGSGIRLENVTATTIGGTAAGDGNTVAFNGSPLGGPATAGVLVIGGADHNPIVGNRFRDNVGLAIDLGGDGVTPIDLAITSFASDGASSSFGIAASGLVPGQTYQLDLYSIAAADPSGRGEGFAYLGRHPIIPDFNGKVDFVAGLPVAPTGHQVITATLTDPGEATSEFVGNFGGNRAPTARAGSPTSTLEGTPVPFDGGASRDDDGDPLTYSWDFGDGTTATGVAPVHTYRSPGSFVVVLTVADGYGGVDTDAITVQVANVAPRFAPAALGAPRAFSSGEGYGTAVAVVGDVLAVASPAGGAVQLIDPATGGVLRTLLDPSGRAASGFGSALAAVGFGLAVGAPGDDASGAGNGAVHLFDANPLSPRFGALLGTLAAPARPGDANLRFGASLAGAGPRLIVGAPGRLTSAAGAPEVRPGGAFVFDTDPTSAEFGRLVLAIDDPANGHGDEFGAAVAAIGDDILVGAPLADAGGVDSGAAWVIDGSTGLPIGAALVDPEFSAPQRHRFGQALAVAGGLIAVAAPDAAFASAPGAGAVYLFAATSRARLATLRSPEPGLGGFGSALASTATTLLVGAPRSSLGNGQAGAAYAFDADPPSPTFGALLLAVQAPEPRPGDNFGASVAFLEDNVLAGAPGTAGAAGRAFFFPAGADLGLSASVVAEADPGFASVILSGQILDPGADEPHRVVIDWKDGPGGSSNVEVLDLAAGVLRFAARHRYAGDFRDARLVTAVVRDSAGGASDPAEVVVSIRNAAPAIVALSTSRSALPEGDAVTLSGRFADPGSADRHTVTVDWGDGSPVYSFALPAGAVSFDAALDANLIHVYRDNPSAATSRYDLKVTVADEAASGSRTVPVTVENLAPSLSGLRLDRESSGYDEGDTVTLSGRIDDAGIDDAHALTIDWGDGSTPQVVLLEPGSRANKANPRAVSFAVPHLYANNRKGEPVSTFEVRVTRASDDDGDLAALPGPLSLTVSNVLPAVMIVSDPGDNDDVGTVRLRADVKEPGPVDRGLLGYLWTLTRPGGSVLTGTGPAFLFPRLDSDSEGGDGLASYDVSLEVFDDIGSGVVRARVVAGTDGADVIDLSGAGLGPFSGYDEVVVLAYAGLDRVTAGGLEIPVYVDGGEGSDWIAGGDGDDTLTTGHGDDTVSGGNGNNVFRVTIGSSPALINDGIDPAAINTIDLSGTRWGLDVDLSRSAGEVQEVDRRSGRADTLALRGRFQNLIGTAFDDLLYGNSDNNEIRGGGGDDLLFAGLGDDTVYSGSGPTGEATLVGGGGSDLLFGGEGRDTLAAGSFDDGMVYTPGSGGSTLVGGSGSQVLYGGLDADSIVAGSGVSNTLAGGGGDDIIFGGEGEDTLAAGSFEPGGAYRPGPGASTLVGGGGGDVLYAGVDGNTLVSGSGGEPGEPGATVVGGPGPDLIFGGLGRDSLVGGPGRNTLVGGAATEALYGGSGDDSIVGGSTPGTGSTLAGGGGDDIIFGGSGEDTLAAGSFEPGGAYRPGPGASTLVGGGGGDVLYAGVDGNTLVSGSGGEPGEPGATVVGGPGPDLIFGGLGRDSLVGGPGRNTLVGGAATEALYGGPDRDSIVGGSSPDGGTTLVGGGGPDIIFGGSGEDTLAAGTFAPDGTFQPAPGDATLVAGSGNSTLLGGSGSNVLFGGSGDDSIVSSSSPDGVATLLGGAGDDVIFAGLGDDTIDGGVGDDTIVGGPGDQLLFGGPGDDTIVSGSLPGTETAPPSSPTLLGGSGGDVLYGGSGNDSMDGGLGDDSVFAGSGDGHLDGGPGDDLVAGGTFAPDGRFVPAAGRHTLAGGGGDDILFGGSGPTTMGAGSFPAGGGYVPGQGRSTLVGGANTDLILGGLGGDSILGGSAPASIVGNAGNDVIFAGGPDATLRGGSGNDTLVGGAGRGVFSGGDGLNTVVESGDLDFVLGDDALIGTDARGATVIEDRLDGIQRAVIVGGDGDNTLDASGFLGSAWLSGGRGDDTLLGATAPGASGSNTLEGGQGDDYLAAGIVDATFVFSGGDLGSDVIARGAVVGRNRLDFSGLKAGVNIDLGRAGEQQVGPSGPRIALPDGRTIRDVVGTDYDDFLVGNDLPNLLVGGGGNDELVGRGGDDILIGGDTQAVFLDFDSLGGPGLHVYTQAERDAIQARLVAIYAAFAYTFSQSRPTSGPYSTIFFNDPGLYGLEAGKADSIDWRNRNAGDDVFVNVNGLLGREGQPAATSENFVAITITIAAHELGHNSGLKHADSYGPIGGGIYSGVDPLSYVDEAIETPPGSGQFVILGYPGPRDADETPQHVLASGQSVRSTLFDAVGPTYFGAREALKIAYSQQGSPTDESPGPHNTPAAAQAIALAPFSVPNTNERGADVGASFDVRAANVIGRIGVDPATGRSESDFYRFEGKAGSILNVDLFSASLSPARVPNSIDGIVRVYLIDPLTGEASPVPYYAGANPGRVAVNDNGFQGLDSNLIDLILPADGRYVVEVDTYNPPGGADRDTGDYELFLYTFARGAGVSPGDSLFGGSGEDTIIGDTTGGSVSDEPGADVVLPGSGETEYLENVAPQFVASGADRTVPPGTVVSLVGSFFEPDDRDVNTFLWRVEADNGDVVPDGTDVSFSFLASRPGTYAVTFTVFDGKAASSSRTIVTAGDVGPVVLPPTTPTVVATEGVPAAIPLGSFADPGAPGGPWTVVVAWGDGQVETFTADRAGSLGSRTHTYADDAPGDADYAVTVTVTDASSGAPVRNGTATFPVSVLNLAPVVSAGGDQTLAAPGPFARTGSFADVPGDGPWTGTVDYGDGSGPQDLSPRIDQGARTFALDHTYTRAGRFTVEVRIRDKDGGEGVGPTFRVVVGSSLSVVQIGPIDRYSAESVSSVVVTFSDPIAPSTFTIDDLTLTKDGRAVALDDATIAPVPGEPTKYAINLASRTDGEGEYALAVDASGIEDAFGVAGQGVARVSWTTDRTSPTSRVLPFVPQRQTSANIQVNLSFADEGSGVGSYDLLVSIDGGGFAAVSGLTNVPVAPGQTGDSRLYVGASNRSYTFRVVARDRAGNVEVKSGTTTDATAIVPDVEAPITQVNAVSPVAPDGTADPTSQTFLVSYSGSDPGSTTGVQSFDVYVQVTDPGQAPGEPQLLATVAANPADGRGVSSGQILYAARADGLEHNYRFYTRARDFSGNLEDAPDEPGADVNITRAFANPTALRATGFTVSRGLASRSFVRYLDILFNQSDADNMGVLTRLLTTGPGLGRFSLTKYRLDGKAAPDPSDGTPIADFATDAKFTVRDRGIEIDFGAKGLGGQPSKSDADGYYELAIDLTSFGGPVTRAYFYRLLGDVDGDQVVQVAGSSSDYALVSAGLGLVPSDPTSPLNADVDGDGKVTQTDRTLVSLRRNRSMIPGRKLGL